MSPRSSQGRDSCSPYGSNRPPRIHAPGQASSSSRWPSGPSPLLNFEAPPTGNARSPYLSSYLSNDGMDLGRFPPRNGNLESGGPAYLDSRGYNTNTMAEGYQPILSQFDRVPERRTDSAQAVVTPRERQPSGPTDPARVVGSPTERPPKRPMARIQEVIAPTEHRPREILPRGNPPQTTAKPTKRLPRRRTGAAQADKTPTERPPVRLKNPTVNIPPPDRRPKELLPRGTPPPQTTSTPTEHRPKIERRPRRTFDPEEEIPEPVRHSVEGIPSMSGLIAMPLRDASETYLRASRRQKLPVNHEDTFRTLWNGACDRQERIGASRKARGLDPIEPGRPRVPGQEF
ncbi:MAG: hypothetical protein Q9222_007189 [Ikaeria aurantiellina]